MHLHDPYQIRNIVIFGLHGNVVNDRVHTYSPQCVYSSVQFSQTQSTIFGFSSKG